MRQRLIAATVLIALSSALAGCGGGLGGWDPTDMLDFLDTKKKLPGDRKPVFPEGVPGLEQGVPKDLYKDNVERQQQEAAQAAAAASAPPPEPAPAARRATKSRSRGQPVAHSAPQADPDAAPIEDGSTAAAPPAPKPKKIVRRRTTAPPPDQEAVQQAAPAAQPQAQPQQAATPFPAPLPSGSFTR